LYGDKEGHLGGTFVLVTDLLGPLEDAEVAHRAVGVAVDLERLDLVMRERCDRLVEQRFGTEQ
jgi:hypothetical protein